MSTQAEASTEAAPPPKYKRRLRNYLIDVGLQVRYTVFIIAVAVFLTAVLGFQIYEATRDTSRIIAMTAMLDPVSARELESQFRASDRTVLASILGFGALLVVSISAAGIWITHKVAGPLYSIGLLLSAVRDNRLSPDVRQLRKGDELQHFHASFREMYEALRARAASDARLLGDAIAILEAGPRSPAVDRTLAELHDLRRQKEESLHPPAR